MVVSRFAPSPTGYLHLGNARTAIFSYLFARHHGGKFILRVEDTDRERSTKEFEEMLLEDLKWLGIEWDEFYKQSERFHIYEEYAQRLIESGHAYPCFCTVEELEEERKKAEERGVPYRYSGKCRALSKEEVEEFKRQGKPYTIRFRVPDGRVVVFEDLIKGHIAINVDDFGDFVIVRSDGTPTYNFVVVVDDALMGVTHVIRGEDHIPNTPKQILIYEALRFEIPKFAHLPVILGEDRSKLSKRHGAVSVRNYREEGYLSPALFNFLCLLGWSPPEEGREIFSKEELIELFTLEGVNSAPAVFNKEKLRWMNGVYIREVLSLDRLVEEFMPFLERAGYRADKEYVKRVLQKTRDSFDTLLEGVERLRPFFAESLSYSEEAMAVLENQHSRDVLELFLQKVQEGQLNSQKVKEIVKEIQRELNLKAKDVWHALRASLTGELEGVGVDILCDVMPKEKVVERVIKALTLLG
ncbi:glutamate--tRNA ligase [Pampinifervens florentissimum]|uniref:glutamate--tRNA ligase n=1 Tax=Pampinifervens florentissimum TaxID=1632019 RepID=UPI0013B48CE6|nr:glutamate--tRNA ligase [Hydrogenobacter sp. T-8]QID33689.1 glutamate--tRNA ligase [Hydrogenobacter sp. T-8]